MHSFTRDRFLKKKCGNETVGVPGLANGERGAVRAEFERRRREDRGAKGRRRRCLICSYFTELDSLDCLHRAKCNE